MLFEPSGRMALSNYVGASVVVYFVGKTVDFTTMTSIRPSLLLALCVLLGQNIISRVWLHSSHYGPAEWIWRMIT